MTRRVRVAHVATVDLTLRYLLLPQLQRLRMEGFDVAGISAPGPWSSDLEARGIRHIPWRNATRSWDPVSDVRAAAELVRILRRERFDVVHTHTPKAGVIGRLAARAVGVPVVVNTVHGLYATPQDRLLRRVAVLSLERLAAGSSDLELYQSGEDLAWARKIGLVTRARSVHLGNGIDLSRFDPAAVSSERRDALRSELGIGAGEVVIGTIGRLVAEKGYRELFRAASRVRSDLSNVRFVVIGDPEPDKADAISSEELARAERDMALLGWREDVPDLLAIMDVFVLASWREGLPRSAIEAAAMGKPLVLTDIRGCREVVRHGVEGFLVPPRDPAGLTAAIVHLAQDRGLRARMGAAARARALEWFDERRVLDTIVRSYRGLLQPRSGVTAARGGGVRVRPAGPADARTMARLHATALPDAFLPTLGEPFLRQLYLGLVGDPQGGVVLVAEDRSGIVGFAAGTRSVRAFYRRFALRRGLVAGLVAVPHLFRPGVLTRIRESARYPAVHSDLPEAELLAIAVDPGWRARGLGRALADQVIDGLADLGAPEVKVVVGADNEGANRFYEQLGFRHAARTAVHVGVASNVWAIRCRSLQPSSSASA